MLKKSWRWRRVNIILRRGARQVRLKKMKHPVDVHVGQRVRQRRWLVGLTQQQLGDKVGIKFQQIQKYETGTNRISASRMWDIAAAMGVPVSFFFVGLNGQAPETGELAGNILVDREAYDLVRAYLRDSGAPTQTAVRSGTCPERSGIIWWTATGRRTPSSGRQANQKS